MTEFLVNRALREYFARSDLHRIGTYERFETENFDWKDGFNSSAIFGHIVYTDNAGKQVRYESMAIKLIPNPDHRSKYIDITFSNEIFMYSRVIPFYATLNNSVLSIFPKFYYGNLALGVDDENALVILENLTTDGYRATDSKTFLDFPHFLVIVKKLARLHAFSYYAKSKQPETFHMLVGNIASTHIWATNEKVGFLSKIGNYFAEMLQTDPHYGSKIHRVRELIKDADRFMRQVYTTKEEPLAVLCHGDFLRNNLMVKYNTAGNPIDVKFIDLPCMQYCTPIADLALVLYMNADQKMRDDHWHDLIDAYCTSLADTFPGIEVPSKEQICKEFKIKSLSAYLIAAFFLPRMMFIEETNITSDQRFFYPEYAEYVNYRWYDLPLDVNFATFCKMAKPEYVQKVLDVLKDIIDRDFV